MVNKKNHLFYSIGDLSKSTGTKVVTIRYYEKIGLLPEPPRTEGGYRAYTKKHQEILFFIIRSRALGFSLIEIQNLLKLSENDILLNQDVLTITKNHLENIRSKISSLQKMEKSLKNLIKECPNGKISGCGIIDSLNNYSDT
ncbi:DNA-binding transcriptional regulator [Commensalibacter communis]|uniref:MerR family transcriptional regulator n=1 Tax=Commensalibacter communis TaxID=2972786 RepID=UPI0022FF63C6|nr:helix-turn-helix domain-containing protein [Commensalibacter communis]CAI3950781.1 DNA-binding transcriptional regulator [Commensalibacter communis]CAI3953610.1 DNA-binding transcriptional regulator [Commensalibacter communis]